MTLARPFAASAALCLVALLPWLAPKSVAAQAPVLTRNDFALDIFTGPVLASGRIVGLGGAYAGIGEGIDAAHLNPASYASRAVYELGWFEWEASLGFSAPGTFSQTDFDNSGRANAEFSHFVFLNGGLRLQFANLGLGISTRAQIYDIGGASTTVTTTNFGVGYALLDGQLVAGLGARTATFDVETDKGENLVSFAGTGYEAGVLWRPLGEPFRLGFAARTPVRSAAQPSSHVEIDAMGVRRAGGYVLPYEAHMPWELSVGFAYQLGRPLNVPWVDPHDVESELEKRMLLSRARRSLEQTVREVRARGEALTPGRGPTDVAWLTEERRRQREDERQLARAIDVAERGRRQDLRELPRRYLLVSAELFLTGPTHDGVALVGLVTQQRVNGGHDASLGMRVGLEGEPWPNRLKLRVGSYLEPSRFETTGYRVHATGGADLRLFRWDLFGLMTPFDLRISISGDITSRYHDWGVGIGFWH